MFAGLSRFVRFDVLLCLCSLLLLAVPFVKQPVQPCGLHAAADLAIVSRRLVINGSLVPGALVIRGGRIAEVVQAAGRAWPPALPPGLPLVDYGQQLVGPGLIDVHVHLNEPGREEWEGIRSGTRAAAAGGISMVVDMPLNSEPVTSTADRLRVKRRVAKGQAAVDIGFWGGLVPENALRPEVLQGLLDGGALGLKAFMSPSGIDSFGHTNETHLSAAVQLLMRQPGAPPVLYVHAELPGPLPGWVAGGERGKGRRARSVPDPTLYSTYLATRPGEWERNAIKVLLRVAALPAEGAASSTPGGARVHVAHVSDAGGLHLLRRAKRRGLALTAETCPHYLLLVASEVPPKATEFKCAPPIRAGRNRHRLRAALRDGTLDLVASDHSPAPLELKSRTEGDFLKAWGGIASLQLLLPATWTAAREARASAAQLSDWLSARPAALAGLAASKGRLAPGYDADVMVWDPDATFVVRGADLHHRHSLTPYENRTLYGVVKATWVRGQLVYSEGQLAGGACGKVQTRPRHGGGQSVATAAAQEL